MTSQYQVGQDVAILYVSPELKSQLATIVESL